MAAKLTLSIGFLIAAIAIAPSKLLVRYLLACCVFMSIVILFCLPCLESF